MSKKTKKIYTVHICHDPLTGKTWKALWCFDGLRDKLVKFIPA